jgi:hypothetical protein
LLRHKDLSVFHSLHIDTRTLDIQAVVAGEADPLTVG